MGDLPPNESAYLDHITNDVQSRLNGSVSIGDTKVSDEVLPVIRKFVELKVAHAVLNDDDVWRHTVGDLLPLYMQFQVLDRLDKVIEALDVLHAEVSEQNRPWK